MLSLLDANLGWDFDALMHYTKGKQIHGELNGKVRS